MRPFSRREPPSAAVALIFSFGPTIRVLDGAGVGEHRSFVAGLHERTALTEFAGARHGGQVDLSPPGAHPAWGRRASRGLIDELDDG